MPLLMVRQDRTVRMVVAEEGVAEEAETCPIVFWPVIVRHTARPAEVAEVAVVEALEVAVAKEAVVHLASWFTVRASQFKRRS
jgi:isopentenyldiphosphate isomerase